VEVPTRVLQVKPSSHLRATLPAHADGVLNVLFSPDGKTLASVGTRGEVTLWDVDARKQRLALPQQGQVYGLAFTPDSKRLLVPSFEPLDAAGKALSPPYRGEVKGLRGGVRICDAGSGKLLGWLRREPARGVTRVFVIADGRTAALWEHARGEKDPATRTSTALWDLQTQRPRTEVPGGGALYGISADGKTLARRDETGGVLWDVAAGKVRAELTRKGEYLGRCLFSRDGRTLAGTLNGPEGTRIVLWDVTSGKRLKQLPAGVGTPLALAFSPDGGRLAVGQGTRGRSVEPCDVLIWDVKTAKLVLTLRGHVNGVSALDFQAGGKLLASGGADGTVRLWEVGEDAAARR
jgi:WD40 repeat protein